MNNETGKIPRWLAAHQAGHAVACWYCDVSYGALTVDGLESRDETAAPASLLENQVLVDLAGPMGEAWARKGDMQAVLARDPADWELAKTRAEAFTAEDSDVDDILQGQTERLRQMMFAPKIWAAINAVAGRLQAHHRLSRDEVVDIIDWVTQSPDTE
jgi:hypothetical protein